MASERIAVLVTPRQKRHITKLAEAAGLTVGEYMRRAAESYTSAEDDAALEGLIKQMVKATNQTCGAIDDVLVFVAESNRRIATLEARANKKTA